MKKFILLVILILTLNLATAMPVEDVKLSNYVNDYTNTLTQEEISSLNTILSSLKATVETSIVIVDNFNDLSKEEYAMEIAHENLGNEDDNGLLILVGLDVREFRIEVGYGLEGDLNDAKVGRLAREFIIPYFQNNQYGQGLIAFTYNVHQELLPNQEIVGVTYSAPQNSETTSILAYFTFIFIFMIFRAISGMAYSKQNKGKKKNSSNSFFTAALLASLFFRGGGRGGMGGGFGGFGGGGFGGGGFGGGW